MSITRIAITGASGTIGRALVPAVLGAAVRVSALTHRATSAYHLRAQGIDAVVVDYHDAAALKDALQGVQKLFLLTPPVPEQAQLERSVIGAALAAGIEHVVKLSASDAFPGTKVPWAAAHFESEALLRQSGLPFSLLRAGAFMQNFLDWKEALRGGALYQLAANPQIAWVDAHDIAAAAAQVLLAEQTGQTHDLSGPDSLSMQDCAATLTAALGHAVTYQPLTAQAIEDYLLGLGYSPWRAHGEALQYQQAVGHAPRTIPDDLPRLLGRPASRFGDFLERERAAFSGAGRR